MMSRNMCKEHVCSLNLKKQKERQHHAVSEGAALGTNKAENNLYISGVYI